METDTDDKGNGSYRGTILVPIAMTAISVLIGIAVVVYWATRTFG